MIAKCENTSTMLLRNEVDRFDRRNLQIYIDLEKKCYLFCVDWAVYPLLECNSFSLCRSLGFGFGLFLLNFLTLFHPC